MNSILHTPADRLPRDIYAPFTLLLDGGARTQTFLPQVLWPHHPSTHTRVFTDELRSAANTWDHSDNLSTTSSTATGTAKGSPARRPVPALLTHHPLAPYILSFPPRAGLPLHDALYFLEAFLGHCLIDRTATLTRLHPVRILDPIPTPPPSLTVTGTTTETTATTAQNTVTSFHAICDARARAILTDAEAHDLDIRVLLHDVDADVDADFVTETEAEADTDTEAFATTHEADMQASDKADADSDNGALLPAIAALVALLRVATPSQRARLVVVHEAGAAKYFAQICPTLQARLLARDIALRERQATPESGYDAEDLAFGWTSGERNFLVVTGGCATALLRGARPAGPRAREAARASGRLPWREVLPKLLEDLRALPRGCGRAWHEDIDRQVARAPVAVLSVHEFLWWIGFSCAWQKDVLAIVQRRERPSKHVLNRVVHFFRADEFQVWALRQRSTHAVCQGQGGDLSNWETPLREYIREATDINETPHLHTRTSSLLWPRRTAGRGAGSCNANDRGSGFGFGVGLGSRPKHRVHTGVPTTLGLDENFEHIRFGRHAISLDSLCETYHYPTLIPRFTPSLTSTPTPTPTPTPKIADNDGKCETEMETAAKSVIESLPETETAVPAPNPPREHGTSTCMRHGANLGTAHVHIQAHTQAKTQEKVQFQQDPAQTQEQVKLQPEPAQTSSSVGGRATPSDASTRRLWRSQIADAIAGAAGVRRQGGAGASGAGKARGQTMRQWAFTYGRRKAPLGSRVKQLRSLVRNFRLGGIGARTERTPGNGTDHR